MTCNLFESLRTDFRLPDNRPVQSVFRYAFLSVCMCLFLIVLLSLYIVCVFLHTSSYYSIKLMEYTGIFDLFYNCLCPLHVIFCSLSVFILLKILCLAKLRTLNIQGPWPNLRSCLEWKCLPFWQSLYDIFLTFSLFHYVVLSVLLPHNPQV